MSTTVRVKSNFQITIPPAIRRRIKVGVGDILEAQVKEERLVLTPKARVFIDRRLDQALADVEAGRVYGPFDTAEKMIAELERRRQQNKK